MMGNLAKVETLTEDAFAFGPVLYTGRRMQLALCATSDDGAPTGR